MFKSVADGLPGGEVLGCAAMAKADAFAARQGVNPATLMERAGAAIGDCIARRWSQRPTAILCGPGNNGGDGFVAARILAAQGWPVSVFCLVEQGSLRGDALTAAEAWEGPVKSLAAFDSGHFGLVVDALFGAGLSRPLGGEALRAAHAANAADLVRVSVDVPSGVNGDAAQIDGEAVRADLTITFHRLKPAHLFAPARMACGEVVCADIGIPDGWQGDAPPLASLAGIGTARLPGFPHVSPVHKHQRGRLCVLAGGPGATSAARLAAEAGLAAGVGLVTLLCPPASLIEATHAALPVMTRAIREDSFDRTLEHHRASVVVMGPGAGVTDRLARQVLEAIGTGLPLLLDADAISALAGVSDADRVPLHDRIVLTPHAGEFERLFPGVLVASATPLEAARRAAEACGAVVVLKGPATVIAAPSGDVVVNVDASARLATAGSGDVLAGLIGGLMAQAIAPFDAACTAVWLHGQAGFLLPPGGHAQHLLDRIPAVLGAAMAEQARQRVLARLGR